MTIQELRKKYYLHDSCISKIIYNKSSQMLEITIDFCQWAQEWYKEGEPENIWIKLVFHGMEEYEELQGDIDFFSILDAEVKEGKLCISILDDFHDEYYELCLNPTDVEVEILGVVEE